eukprot:m.705261 g.705261  ORF g.705261 m.705261 type:complete len:272 (+) comp22926_c0_seq9:67-882(+)
MMARKIVEEDEGYFLVDKDDADAKRIAASIPGFDFKGIPMFFDVGGLVGDIEAFQLAIDIFVERYKAMEPPVTSVCGLDARGFLFGPPVALALKVPFFMMRKQGKLPGPTMEVPYKTEYSDEVLTIPCTAVKPGDRVVIFDDLIATGGTTIAAANLIVEAGGVVAEVAVITAIAFFKGWKKFRSSLPQLKDVSIFSIVEATNCLVMPEGSTGTYNVSSGSKEHKKITEAMKQAKLGDVLTKTGEGDAATFHTQARGPQSLREKHGSAYAPE